MAKQKQSFIEYFKQRTKSNWVLYALMTLLGAFCIGSIIYFLIIGRYRDCLVAFTYMQIIPLFYVLEKYLHIRAPFAYAFLVVVYTLFCFLGASYNFYTLFLNLDDVLHAVFGVVFAILGFAVVKSLIGEPKTNKQFITCLVFAFSFSLVIAVVWEIYEFTGDRISVNLDMQEDTIINSFQSFLLNPGGYDHLNTLQIDGIAYTVLYDAEGNILYTIEGGYLDVGLFDTMMDIIWCTVADVALCVLLAVDWRYGKRIYRFLIPSLVESEIQEDAVEPLREQEELANCANEPADITEEPAAVADSAEDRAEK